MGAAWAWCIRPKTLDSTFALKFLPDAFAPDLQALSRFEREAQAASAPAIEDTLLANEADTAAYSPRLRKSQEFSQQAIGSAERAGEKETAGELHCHVCSTGSLVW